MKKQFSIAFIVLLILAGCATANQNSTPTIVPLDRTVMAQSATATAENAPPTPTPIPFPTATPAVLPTALPVAESVSITPTPQPTATAELPQIEVVTTALRVRQGPGVDYPVLGTARQGDLLPVLGRDPSGNWVQVEFAGQTGWMSALPQFSRLRRGNVDALPEKETPAPPAIGAALGRQPTGNASGRLVFATQSGGDLYVVNVDGSGLRKLAGGVIDPAVSPDGRQVAFTRWDGAEFGTLFSVDIAGGAERVIATEIRQAKSPAWSPDGQSVIVSFQHGGLRDPQRRCRKFKPGEKIDIPFNSQILWVGTTADGRIRICFIRNEDLQWSLRRIDVNSGRSEDLPVDLYAFSPAWDPKNAWRVIYSGDKGLMQLDVNSGRQWPLSTDLRDRQAVFSPDGQVLAVTYKQHDHWEVYTLNPASGERIRLTKPPILATPQYSSAAPVWSPDGQQIAFVTDRAGPWEIWVMAADGSNPRPLLPPEVQAQVSLNYAGVNDRLLNWLE